MPKLNYNQRMAVRYYNAYSALCHPVDDTVTRDDEDTLRYFRDMLLAQYKMYDPDNSFDVSTIKKSTANLE